MELYIDTANVEEIKDIWSLGILGGVTTNPTLIAREKVAVTSRLAEILAATKDIPVNAEAIGSTAVELVAHGRDLAAIDERIVIKIPLTKEGLVAINLLSKAGIRTNATLVFNAPQCLAAALAGASFISPFLGRLADNNRNYLTFLKDCQEIWQNHQLKARIIAASIRKPEHITEAAKLGCHIATVPYKILLDMIKDPLTDEGIKKFDADWAETLAFL